MEIDQAEVVNDNDRKLPKVPPKYCEGVHYIERNLAKAFWPFTIARVRGNGKFV